MHPKPILGLAGGIGSGKSTVARMLAGLGCLVIDSDALSHQVLNEPAVLRQIAEWWGPSVLKPDGSADRRAISAKTFQNPAELARLTAVIHPRVAQLRAEQMAAAQTEPTIRAIVLDTPLLFESGLNQSCDRVLFVKADDAVRAERLRKNRGWSAEERLRREKFQFPLDKKEKMSDDVLQNNGAPDSSLRQLALTMHRLFPHDFPADHP